MATGSKDSDNCKVLEKVNHNFENIVIKEALKLKMVNNKGKINEDVLSMTSELAKIMTVETALRATQRAQSMNENTVTLDHMEAVLPQVMLDFP